MPAVDMIQLDTKDQHHKGHLISHTLIKAIAIVILVDPNNWPYKHIQSHSQALISHTQIKSTMGVMLLDPNDQARENIRLCNISLILHTLAQSFNLDKVDVN